MSIWRILIYTREQDDIFVIASYKILKPIHLKSMRFNLQSDV